MKTLNKKIIFLAGVLIFSFAFVALTFAQSESETSPATSESKITEPGFDIPNETPENEPPASVDPNPKTSYIIIHALNPEGIEIASIEGVAPQSVELYNGDTLIGHGAHNNETYNKPIAISPGEHAIKVKFNGMELSQNININKEETKIITFKFERTNFDLHPYIYNSDLSSGISGSWSGITPRIDDDDKHNKVYWKTNVHHGETCGNCYGNYNADAKLEFHLMDTIYTWHNRAFYDIYLYYTGYCPYYHGNWAATTHTDSGTYSFPSKNTGFINWHLQTGKVEGNVKFYIDDSLLVSNKSFLISAADDSSLRIIINEQFNVTGHTTNKDGNHLWQTLEDSGEGTLEAYMSSVPYDLTGTGIKYVENQPPVASFTYSPEYPKIGEEITFDASSSYDPDGTIEKYEWDFNGDGVVDAKDKIVTHTYTEADKYTISLTVTDNKELPSTTQLNAISGTIYKNEDLDASYSSKADIFIGDVIVQATLDNKVIAEIQANEKGEYLLFTPYSKTGYSLKVSLPSKETCFDPEEKAWGNWSTIKGEKENIQSPSKEDISVEYRMLNYGPKDFSWELWHEGPIFDKDNVVLIHGINIWPFDDSTESKGKCDKTFAKLDNYLQSKANQYNAWQFEYKDPIDCLTLAPIDLYANRLGNAIVLIRKNTDQKTTSIIAHSMGGIVARKYISIGGMSTIKKLITLATPHMGVLNFGFFGMNPDSIIYTSLLGRVSAASELRPDSSLLWQLNTNVESSISSEFVAVGGYKHCVNYGLNGCMSPRVDHDDSWVEIASASLVKSRWDGSVADSLYFTGIFRSHIDINNIKGIDDEAYQLIRTFLHDGAKVAKKIWPDEEPKKYKGQPYLTFALKKYPKRGYPILKIQKTQNEYKIVPTDFNKIIFTQSQKTPGDAIIYTVHLVYEDYGKAEICFAQNRCESVEIQQGQSTIVTREINNSSNAGKKPEKVALSVTPVSANTGGFAFAGSTSQYTKHSLWIAPNSLAEDTPIYISEPIDNYGLSSAVEFGPNGTIFDKPSIVTVEYKDNDVPSGYNEDEMRLVTWEDGGWKEVLDSKVNLAENIVSGEVAHLSAYAAGIPSQLKLKGVISGRVTDEAGNGISGIGVNASVYLVPDEGEYTSVITNENGYYAISGLPSGKYFVSTWPTDIYIGKYYNNIVDPANAGKVFVSSPYESANINFQLTRGYTISGKVVDINGNPIENITVSAWYNGHVPPTGSDGTDKNGNYTTSAIAQGTYYLLAGSKKGGQPDSEGYPETWYPNAPLIASSLGNNLIIPSDAIQIEINDHNLSGYNFVLKKPRVMIEKAVSELEVIKVNDKKVKKTINSSIRYLRESLDANLWIDAIRLDPGKGEKVFDLNKKAVNELLKSIKQHKLSDAVKSSFEQIISALVEADEILARMAINKAKNTPVQNSKKENKINQLIQQAEESINNADGYSEDNPDKAIEELGLAWKYAQKAIALANKNN